MNQAAILLEHSTIYWYSIVLALAVGAGLCFFLACCSHAGIPLGRALGTALAAVILSVPLSRLLYWYCRGADFDNLFHALTAARADGHALAGAFAGCALSALVLGRRGGYTLRLLDAMSVAGCGAIALGRLGNFFTAADRGQIVESVRELPWVYKAVNAASGAVEYRLATFVLQALAAGGLFVVLALLYGRRKRPGKVTLVFLMVYSASQIVLDSTRYDALHLRSNGFINMVQMLAAIALVVCLTVVAIQAANVRGISGKWVTLLLATASLLGLAGYMEYYVQRHGKQALEAYCVMSLCLGGVLAIAFVMGRMAGKKKVKT